MLGILLAVVSADCPPDFLAATPDVLSGRDCYFRNPTAFALEVDAALTSVGCANCSCAAVAVSSEACELAGVRVLRKYTDECKTGTAVASFLLDKILQTCALVQGHAVNAAYVFEQNECRTFDSLKNYCGVQTPASTSWLVVTSAYGALPPDHGPLALTLTCGHSGDGDPGFPGGLVGRHRGELDGDDVGPVSDRGQTVCTAGDGFDGEEGPVQAAEAALNLFEIFEDALVDEAGCTVHETLAQLCRLFYDCVVPRSRL